MGSLRRILHGAVQAGASTNGLTNLDLLLTEDIYRPALRWHVARKPAGANADIKIMVDTLFSIASFIGLGGVQLALLKKHASKVTPPPRRDVTPRLRKLLDQLDDPWRQAKLLHLPQTLLQEAVQLRDGWTDARGIAHAPRPVEAGFLAGVAAAIEIELLIPLRITNLTNLRLGQEMQFPQGRKPGAGIAIRVAGEVVKNKMTLEADLEGAGARLIHRYLTEFRPLLPTATGVWLFPGQKGVLYPRNSQSLGRAIMDAVHSHAGVELYPHAFRGFVASLILKANPGDIDTVRCSLGHSTNHTAQLFYKRFETRGAAARVAALVQNSRRSTSPVAKPKPRDATRRVVPLPSSLNTTAPDPASGIGGPAADRAKASLGNLRRGR